MPQALKPLSLTHIGSWKNSPFPLLALWGNKNGLPCMKVKKLENFRNKIGLMGCKWSNLNAPNTEIPVSHPFLGHSLFPYFQPLLSPRSHTFIQIIVEWSFYHLPPVKKTSCFKIFSSYLANSYNCESFSRHETIHDSSDVKLNLT